MLANQQKPGGTVCGSWDGARIAREKWLSQPSHCSELSDLGQVNLSAPFPPVFIRRGLGSLQFHRAVVPLYCELRKGSKVLVLPVQDIEALTMFILRGFLLIDSQVARNVIVL